MVGSDTDLPGRVFIGDCANLGSWYDSQADAGDGNSMGGVGNVVKLAQDSAVATYPPIKPRETMTATGVLQAQEFNEASLERMLVDLNGLSGGLKIRASGTEARLQATIKAKDEIIAGLHTDIARLLDINQAWYREARQHREDSELRSIGLDALTQANKELQAKLDKTEEECRNLHDALTYMQEAPPEPKPNTRDMSRLGHFGESHAKNGLSLFDRYY